jgi:hypothetical protein
LLFRVCAEDQADPGGFQMNGAGQQRELTLRGIVTPIAWDEDGAVRTVAILTRDEGEYEVIPGGAGGRLLQHLRREILAQAEMVADPMGVKRVNVSSFALLEWNDSDEEAVTTLNVKESRE